MHPKLGDFSFSYRISFNLFIYILSIVTLFIIIACDQKILAGLFHLCVSITILWTLTNFLFSPSPGVLSGNGRWKKIIKIIFFIIFCPFYCKLIFHNICLTIHHIKLSNWGIGICSSLYTLILLEIILLAFIELCKPSFAKK